MRFAAVDLTPTVGKGVEGPLSKQTVTSPQSGFGEMVNAIISAVFVFAGLALVVYFAMGAFNYITAGGDEKALDKAKKTIWDAIIGFLILAVTFLVLDIVSNILGFTILNLTFKGL